MSRTGPHLVTVIIPCYNQGRFLGEAIESALGQDYSAVEVVVVDDGSSDETWEVATSYRGVRLITESNRGLARARNLGLEGSRGEYVVFLDADDRLAAGALAVGAESLDSHPDCAFVSGHYNLISLDGSLMPHSASPCAQGGHYQALLRGNYIGMHATVTYRRDVLNSVGGFDISRRACEDYDLYLRIARRFPIFCHHAVVAEYRQHGDNMSRDCALMMKASLSVLGSQRQFVRGDRILERAYRDGVRFWRDYWTRGLIKQVKRSLESREWNKTIGLLLTLLRYNPRAIVRGGGSVLGRKIGKLSRLLLSASPRIRARR